MLNKFLLLVSCLICGGAGAASEVGFDKSGNFYPPSGARIFVDTPFYNKKDGSSGYFSFTVPDGFYLSRCVQIKQNSSNEKEIYCESGEGDFDMVREDVSADGSKLKISIGIYGSYLPEKLLPKDPVAGAEEAFKGVLERAKVEKTVSQGPVELGNGKKGYQGSYFYKNDYNEDYFTKAIYHYVDKCAFLTAYREVDPKDKAKIISIDKWKYADIQEKLQSDFRCELLSKKRKSKFKENKNWKKK